MDRNLLLAFALSFLVLSLWAMLQQPVKQPPGAVAPQGTEKEAVEPSPPPPPPPVADRYPELPAAAPSGAGEAPRTETGTEPELAAGEGEQIVLTRPDVEVSLDSRGGVIRAWELRHFVDAQGNPITMVDAERNRGGAAATPFVELGFGDLSKQVWSVDRAQGSEVSFGVRRDGVRISKTYRFEDGGYGFRLQLELANESAATVASSFLVEWPIAERPGNDFRQQSLAALYDGSLKTKPLASLGSAGFWGFFTGARGDAPILYQGEIDWAGVETPYFLAALFPDQPRQASARFLALEKGKRGVAQLYFEPIELTPGQRAERVFRGYAGPKEPKRLEAFSPSAVASINLGYSWVAPLTRGFSWLLHAMYSFIPNYGVAIIVLTVLVRLVTAPLTMKQMRSMERMRRIQPKMKEIQEKFADDRQRQSEEMMRLYRQEKVNPLGGCLPMVLQLPVFIGLFYALRSSIDLRQAPFFGWIDDLSAPDQLFVLPGLGFPVRVLPLVMGASMFFQQKISPMQADPAQARMMMTIMPIMMTFVSYTFPSGLVLYWMLSNVLAIGHQLWIGRKMDTPGASGGAKAGKGGKAGKKPAEKPAS